MLVMKESLKAKCSSISTSTWVELEKVFVSKQYGFCLLALLMTLFLDFDFLLWAYVESLWFCLEKDTISDTMMQHNMGQARKISNTPGIKSNTTSTGKSDIHIVQTFRTVRTIMFAIHNSLETAFNNIKLESMYLWSSITPMFSALQLDSPFMSVSGL